MSVAIKYNIAYIEGAFGEPKPKFFHIRLKYLKRRDVEQLKCRVIQRGYIITEDGVIDVSSQAIGQEATYDLDLTIVSTPITVSTLYDVAVPLTTEEQSFALSEDDALVVIVRGDPTGKLDIIDELTGTVIGSIQPKDVDANGVGASYAVIIPSTRVTLSLRPTNVAYSVYKLPQNNILSARSTYVLQCSELDANGATISTIFSSISLISVKMEAKPELVIEITAWEASG